VTSTLTVLVRWGASFYKKHLPSTCLAGGFIVSRNSLFLLFVISSVRSTVHQDEEKQPASAGCHT
jgi:hypothetical protein